MNTVRLSTLSLTIAIAVMTLGYANPSFADPPSGGEHDHGGGGGGADGAMFTVKIDPLGMGEVLQGGSGEDWVQGFGGKKAIGLNDAAPVGLDVGTLTGLHLLTVPDGPDNDGTVIEMACFPGDFVGPDGSDDHGLSPELHQAFIKAGKKGRAEASFWFHGKTFERNVRVLYLLKLIGEFESDKEWPGAQTLRMTDWELKVENEGKDIKSISCHGKGKDSVTIEVT